MKVAFYARYTTHHLSPFCEAMYRALGDNFTFIEVEPLPDMRANMGYAKVNTPYGIRTYEDNKSYVRALELCREVDVAIIGGGSYEYLEERFRTGNKLTFKLKERLFKLGINKRFQPEVKHEMYQKHQQHFDKNLYYLCAGTFTAIDLKLLGMCTQRLVKWGYFPPVRHHEEGKLLKDKGSSSTIKMLWVGRFLKPKHPSLAVEVIKYLTDRGHDVVLDFVGLGEMEAELRSMVVRMNVQQHVNFQGKMPPDEVREHMYKADIFLLTSNYQEGWGAVLSEAMNEGCAVVSSTACGSTGFLVSDGVNGLMFNRLHKEELFSKVLSLVVEKKKIRELGLEAYRTIRDVWNAEVACERFLKLAGSILENGSPSYYANGPCSLAPPIKNMKELGRLGRVD